MLLNISKLFVTSLGLGYIKKAPGTWGAFLGIVILYIFSILIDSKDFNIWRIISCIVLTLLSLPAIKIVEKSWDTHDDNRIVIDETIGVVIATMFVPITMSSLIVAFILFRIFDIAKPFGIRTIDQTLPGALGVMLDDIVAGIYACLCLNIIHHWINPF